ncbi:Hypothetical protein Nlim_1271 [Candidatus Nitrosarchaeum limnium SFB1]|jgi:hypothetical protein|uniref:Uncharacterized protein n=1 Tax=Candidatus Nitrosarchaeum limnium SFB1 TaxID=886738 RepID=F3KL93_9ARCH|nr:Hypothetical protein Nlim_1271 [Candidatus Nitrosarchaeum limnium SFB1]
MSKILSEIQGKNKMNLKYGFAIVIVSLFVMSGFNTNLFAEELEKVTFIAVDKEQFEQPHSKYNNEHIIISGYVKDYTRGDEILIEIIYPDQSQNEIHTHATKKGEIYTLFDISNDSQIGVYQVILKYRDVELATTSFEIIEK